MYAKEEGVFQRPRASCQDESNQGELVDRLMAKIAELEVKLYEKDLSAKDTIPAVRGASTLIRHVLKLHVGLQCIGELSTDHQLQLILHFLFLAYSRCLQPHI